MTSLYMYSLSKIIFVVDVTMKCLCLELRLCWENSPAYRSSRNSIKIIHKSLAFSANAESIVC